MTKVFVDTLFVVALINRRDRYHLRATELAQQFQGRPLITTDAVLLEIGNALARGFKSQATEVLDHFLQSDDIEIVRLTPDLFHQGFALYRAHDDKDWGLVDCISFVVMHRAGTTEALTFDRHFVQAGFRALLQDGSA